MSVVSAKTGIDHKAIQSSENLLLTFGNLRNEVGEGNDIFTRATKLTTDMSVSLGQDLKSSAIQLGKALNDPIKGITALSRVGVSFTQQQKDQVKALVDSGDALEAQKLILTEVERQFKGSAEAQATATGEAPVLAGDLAESIGGAVLPEVDSLATVLGKGADGIKNFNDSTGGLVGKLAVGAVGFNLIGGAASLAVGQAIKFRAQLGKIRTVAPRIWSALKAGGPVIGAIGLAFIASKVAADHFNKGIKEVNDVVDDLAGSSTQALVDAFDALGSKLEGTFGKTDAAALRWRFPHDGRGEHRHGQVAARRAAAEGEDVSALDGVLQGCRQLVDPGRAGPERGHRRGE